MGDAAGGGGPTATLGCAAGAGGVAAGALTVGAGAAAGFATDAAGGAFAPAAGAAAGGAAAGGAAGDGGTDETGAGDAVAAWADGCSGAGLTADRTGCPLDEPADAGELAGLGAELACGCCGWATACCWLGEACDDCGSGSLAYFARRALAATISFAPLIFCSFISLRHASMTGSVALRQRTTASGNSVTIKSPRSMTILATAAAC